MSKPTQSSPNNVIVNAAFNEEWNIVLALGAIGVAFISTYDSAPWLRTLVIVNIMTLLMFVFWNWLIKCGERLGDIKPHWRPDGPKGPYPQSGEAYSPAERALAFEDRLNDEILVAGKYSRHAGLVSLWWTPDVDANVNADVVALHEVLVKNLAGVGIIHFVDVDRAWVLAPLLRSWDELERLQNNLVSVLLHQSEAPLRKIAAGCAMSPLHGYDARSLIEFADENQDSQVQVHPFPTQARATLRPLPPAPQNLPQPSWRTDRVAS